MATNDFWKRVAGDLGTDEGNSELRISVELLGGVLGDLSLGLGGITVAQARAMMRLDPGTDANSEFTDLINSAATITNANATTQRLLRGLLVEGIRYAAAIGERQDSFPSNPYGTGEAVRLRTKALI